MHTSLLPLLCRRLCAVAVWPLLILSAVRADGEPFVARFETDATGTWLTYPTVPGWHYKVESSPTLEEDDFTFVPSTFSYGNGTVRRLFIAPPRPPADPNYQPPVRTFRLINVRLHVATDPGMEKVELLGPGDPPAWGMEMNRSLPVFRWPRHVFLTGDTPTERWMFSATITARPYTSEDPATPGFQFPGPAVIPQSAQADIDFVTDHWQDIIGHLTPSPEDTTLLPAPPPPVTSPENTPAPPLTSPARRYYRVRQTAIDTNGNGLYDWWELAHAYSAFAEPGTPGYLDGTADPDHDGLTNTQEQNNGTNHLHWDSDGDWSSDSEEALTGTDPLDAGSTLPGLLFSDREISGYQYLTGTAPGYNGSTHHLHWSGRNNDGLPIEGYIPGALAPGNPGPLPYLDFATLIVAAEFPATPILAPWWAEPRTSHSHVDHRDEEGARLEQLRTWYRDRAPADSPLHRLALIVKRRTTYIDYIDAPRIETEEYKLAQYVIPPGGRISQPVDITPELTTAPSAPVNSREIVDTELQMVDGSIIIIDGEKYAMIPTVDLNGFPIPPGIFQSTIPLEGDGVVTVPQPPLLQDDANMDGVIDDDDEAQEAPGSQIKLKQSARGVILDINNNNTDAANVGSPTRSIHDHLSPDLDTPDDYAELISTSSDAAAGHLSGQLVIRMHKSHVAKLSTSTATKDFSLYLKRTGDTCIRIHTPPGAGGGDFGLFRKRTLGIPGDTGEQNQNDARSEQFIGGERFLFSNPDSNGNLTCRFVMEGVKAGTCDVVMEIRKTDGSEKVQFKDSVKVLVNVDQLPSAQEDQPKAIPLAGTKPHYAGIDFGDAASGITTPGGGIVALRGRFRAELPASKVSTSWKPQLTHRHRKLRLEDQLEAEKSSASFWFSLNSRPNNEPGNLTHGCWVQVGLILSQDANDSYANEEQSGACRLYLENGRVGLVPMVNHQYVIGSASSTGENHSQALQNWDTKGVLLDFVLFHDVESDEADENDQVGADEDPWFLVAKDSRMENSGYYILLNVGIPYPQSPSPSLRAQIRDLHNRAIIALPEVKTELSNSAGFLFGNDNYPAAIERLEYAVLRNGTRLAPNTGGVQAANVYNWAMGEGNNDAKFDWTPLHPVTQANSATATEPYISLQTGRGTFDAPETLTIKGNDGVVDHLFWNVSRDPLGAAPPSLESIKFKDSRNWAFPSSRR